MIDPTRRRLRIALMLATALTGLGAAGAAAAQTTDAAQAPAGTAVQELIVTVSRTTRSSVSLAGQEAQKILPGVSPLKAIESLPGVVFETADPWGNNEQNEALFVHGFSTQQLGYTMDGVPLGDQQYGNYNGLSPSRAITSENVSRVELSSGAGSLGVASTSNLGGAIESFSSDPLATRTFDVRETGGSYDTTRTFIRVDSGDFGDHNRLYVSGLYHSAKAWDFNGYQNDQQVNLKFEHDGPHGKLTIYSDWDNKVEPNEDAINYGNQQTAAGQAFIPYKRPFLYPNIAQCVAYVAPNGAPAAQGGNGNLNGTPPTEYGNNFSNCFSAAQRTDELSYAKYDANLGGGMTWANQVYEHYDYGRGIVAGPINQAGLPGLFAAYYPNLVEDKNGNPVPITQAGANSGTAGSLANLSNLFGGTGYEVRTTEYRINREGAISTFDWRLGAHQIELGVWWEHNEPAQHRVWYPFTAANNDLTPYDIPVGPHILTQYYAEFFVNDEQIHLQDQWRVIPSLLLQAGFKSSLQTADGKFPINQVNLPTANPPTQYPSGSLTSNQWFLPQVGGVWDANANDQLFFNVQKNMRQFIPYGAGSNFYGFSPWSLGTQAAFNLFKSTVQPETSWTYEVGARTHMTTDLGMLTGIEGQVNYYHVDFSNRLLNVAPYSFINPAPAILVNVGGVTTNGVDLAATAHFGSHFQLYDALSYNKTTYNESYDSGISGGVATVVATAGKWVPLTPDWLERFIASANFGPFQGQVSGDYIGRRYVTYLNDLSVPGTFQLGLEASYRFDTTGTPLKGAKLSLNATNLTNTKGVSTAVVTSASGGYQGYPIAPPMGWVTLQATF
jgi:outer membrane receptor protein involved in Fe transport